MREIKFRAWAVASKEMFYPNSENGWELVNGILEPLSNAVLMQSTGLKDKNGILIYEGDIVKHPSGLISPIEYIVKQEKPGGLNNWISYDAPYDFSGFAGISYGGVMEIIGNIWETPELTTNKN